MMMRDHVAIGTFIHPLSTPLGEPSLGSPKENTSLPLFFFAPSCAMWMHLWSLHCREPNLRTVCPLIPSPSLTSNERKLMLNVGGCRGL